MTISIKDLLTPAQIEDIAEHTFILANQEHDFGTVWAQEKEFWVKSIVEDLDELLPLVLSALSDRMNSDQASDVLGRIIYGVGWADGGLRATKIGRVRGILNTLREV